MIWKIVGSSPTTPLMAQRINTLSLRLKKRLSWPFFSSAHNIKNLSNIQASSYHLLFFTKIIFFKFSFFLNSYIIQKNLKSYRFFSKLLDDFHILNALIQNSPTKAFNLQTQQYSRFQSMKKKKKAIRFLHFGNKHLISEINDFWTARNKLKSKTNNNLFLLSPQLLTLYILKQLNENKSSKNFFFFRNMQLGILKYLSILLAPQKALKNRLSSNNLQIIDNNIIGLKIIFSGRWKKTKNGRGQRLVLSFGSLKRTALSKSVFFSFFSEKTKFAACGLKVWLTFRSPSRSSLA